MSYGFRFVATQMRPFLEWCRVKQLYFRVHFWKWKRHIVSLDTSQHAFTPVWFVSILRLVKWQGLHGSVRSVCTLCLVFIQVVSRLIFHASHCQPTLSDHIIVELCRCELALFLLEVYFILNWAQFIHGFLCLSLLLMSFILEPSQ